MQMISVQQFRENVYVILKILSLTVLLLYYLMSRNVFQVHRSSAHQAGVGAIFDRVLSELVAKMKEMKIDKTELGCLRSIVLFNPGGQLERISSS